ncbi:MAG: pyrophosphatase PpaX [Chloroflexota bacterium]
MRDCPPMPSTVLFDLDGTLIDTVELIVRSFQHVAERHLATVLDRAAVVATIGRPLLECLDEMAPGRGEALCATYRAFNRAHHDLLVQPIPGARDALAALRRRGYRLGLVTSKPREGAEMALVRYDMGPLLDVIVCLEDTARHKPAPDPLLHACHLLGVAPHAALYVGDSTFDVLSAQAAGMPVAAVLWGAGTPEALAALDPHYLVRDPAALLELLPDRTDSLPCRGEAVGLGEREV